ncbi:MAG: DUF2961 domain-containing protein [Chryseolinea sp.]
MGVGTRNNGWWGEGEIKFFMDGDKENATIVGTGTEDYFCGSYNFENKAKKQYEEYSTPYAGLHQVIPTGWIIHFSSSDSECIAGTFRIPLVLIQI